MADINQPAGQRYANTDEMRAEFGDYRVRNNTENLSDAKKPVPSLEVTNDPFTLEENNKTL